jgi:hypothetical protein
MRKQFAVVIVAMMFLLVLAAIPVMSELEDKNGTNITEVNGTNETLIEEEMADTDVEGVVSLFQRFRLPPPTPATDVDLFFLVDGSGSIGYSDFQLQKEGLAYTIKDSTVIPQDGSVSVCVIQFSDYARLEVPLTTITSQSVADSISANIMAMSQINGWTNMSGAFDLAVANFPSVPAKRQVIDLSTDGIPNKGYDPMIARDAAVSAGFDDVNTLGIGSDIDEALLRNIAHPQPWTKPPGFYTHVSDFQDFHDKMEEKIIKEIRPICEPCVSVNVHVSINKNSYRPGDILVYNVSVTNNQTYKPGKSRIAIPYGFIDSTAKTFIIGTHMPDIYLNDTYNFSGDFMVSPDVYSGNYVFFASAIDMETGCSGIDAKPYSVELPQL